MTFSRTRRGFVLGTAGASATLSACGDKGSSRSTGVEKTEVRNTQSIRFPRLPAEEAAGVVNMNTDHPPGDVRRYGALGDGVADDSAAIQMAIDVAAHTSNWQVTFAQGVYRVRVPITDSGRAPDSKLVLNGNSSVVVVESPGGEFLKLMAPGVEVSGLVVDGQYSGFFESHSATILVSDANDVVISGCTFESIPNMCVRVAGVLSGCQDVRISGCKFNGSRGSAIHVDTSNEGIRAERLSITQCAFVAPLMPNHAQTRAIHLASGAYNTHIANNSMVGTATADYVAGWRDAIMIGNSESTNQPSGVVITDNSITGMADDGVGIAGARHVSVLGNIIFGSLVTSGVYCPANGQWTNYGVIVSDNTLFNHHLAGIFLKDTATFSITGNEIHDCQDGIEIVDTTPDGSAVEGGIVANNHIHDVRRCGIVCDGARVVVNSNSINRFGSEPPPPQTRRVGIFLSSLKPGSTINGNSIVNGRHGIVLTGQSGNFVLANNTCAAIAGYGLYFIDFNGEDWLVLGNRLAGEIGQVVNRPSLDERKVWTANL